MPWTEQKEKQVQQTILGHTHLILTVKAGFITAVDVFPLLSDSNQTR